MSEIATVHGVFADRVGAEAAVRALEQASFTAAEVGILLPSDAEPAADSKRAILGTGGGAVAGGVLGALTALLIPGIGPAVAGGMLLPLLVGVGTGTAGGGVVGGLLSMASIGGDYFQKHLEAGSSLVVVHSRRPAEAIQILLDAGAAPAEPVDSGVVIDGEGPSPR